MHDPLPDIWSGQRQTHSPGHCLRHPAYCISLRRHLIIRHRHQKSSDEYSTMRGFERQTTFTQLSPHDGGALCPVLLLAIVPLLQCLIYKLNFILTKREKYVSAAERPPGLLPLPGNRGGNQNGARMLCWKGGGCLSERVLLKSSCWEHPGKC